MPDVQYPDDPISNPSAIRIEDLLGGDVDPAAASPSVPVREGLPRSFRMRADKHYVEMLDTPPKASVGESLPDRGAIVAVQAGRDLSQSLSALRASTNLLSDRGGSLAATVAANLIRAEAWRATCLLQASRFLRGEIAPAPKPMQAQAIIGQVLKSIEPERRLRGAAIEERINVGDARILVDEDLVVGAMSGLVMAMMALGEEHSAFTVTVAATARASEIVMAIAQEVVGAPSNWATDAVLVAAAGRIVTACGGTIDATANASGTEVLLVLPALR